MAQKLKTTMAPDLDLRGGYTVEWDAVSPTTGASVAGVVVSNTSLLVSDLGTAGGQPVEALGPYFLVPGPGA
jgi:hypothetical protein